MTETDTEEEEENRINSLGFREILSENKGGGEEYTSYQNKSIEEKRNEEKEKEEK